MKPKLSYTIWFTQRTGSQLLCKALQGTEIAGNPDEWLHSWLENRGSGNPNELQAQLWKNGSSANGVFVSPEARKIASIAKNPKISGAPKRYVPR